MAVSADLHTTPTKNAQNNVQLLARKKSLPPEGLLPSRGFEDLGVGVAVRPRLGEGQLYWGTFHSHVALIPFETTMSFGSFRYIGKLGTITPEIIQCETPASKEESRRPLAQARASSGGSPSTSASSSIV